MNIHYQRSAEALSRSLTQFGVSCDLVISDNGITVPMNAATDLLRAISYVEGGSRIPFINQLLRTAAAGDVLLEGDEAQHLSRALDDVYRQKWRNDMIDRGRIPGAMSAAEFNRYIRRHPGAAAQILQQGF